MLFKTASFTRGLAGVRVLDFTWAGAGPFATELLCLMGADVVKVESADRPDLLRVANRAYGWGDTNVDASPCFNDMNAGKRSIALDLKHPAGRETALRLASRADVVCDNMRAGKMEALGLGYEQLRAVRQDIICCSVSATGRVSGMKTPDVAGYAPVFWAEGGGASVTGMSNGPPAYLRAPVDMNAAAFAAVGMLAALYRRKRTGEGARIDCSAIETVASVVGDGLLAASLDRAPIGLRGNDRPPYAPNDVFPCSGVDQWIAISVGTTQQWLALCDVLGAADISSDASLRSRLGRWHRRSDIYPMLCAFTREREARSLEAELLAAGVPTSRSRSIADQLTDEALNARGFWQQVTHPLLGKQKIGTLAFRMTPPLAPPRTGGPLLGEHTEQVLVEWLSLGSVEISHLNAQGVTGTAEKPVRLQTEASNA
jgi:benzylsuccinate CoA-transferase BbsF subunit